MKEKSQSNFFLIMLATLVIVTLIQSEAEAGFFKNIFGGTHTKKEMEEIKRRLPKKGETQDDRYKRLGIPTARERDENIINSYYSDNEYIKRRFAFGDVVNDDYIAEKRAKGVSEENIERIIRLWAIHNNTTYDEEAKIHPTVTTKNTHRKVTANPVTSDHLKYTPKNSTEKKWINKVKNSEKFNKGMSDFINQYYGDDDYIKRRFAFGDVVNDEYIADKIAKGVSPENIQRIIRLWAEYQQSLGNPTQTVNQVQQGFNTVAQTGSLYCYPEGMF